MPLGPLFLFAVPGPVVSMAPVGGSVIAMIQGGMPHA
jgi:hypothetical protein